MACDCIDDINGELAKHNGKLSLTFNFSGGTWPTLEVEKVDRKKRVRPPLVIPTFCPFCGTKYKADEAQAGA